MDCLRKKPNPSMGNSAKLVSFNQFPLEITDSQTIHMGPLSAPAGFNNRSRSDKIDYFLEIGLLIHPCRPPDATGCVDPGKSPKWTVERRLKASVEERRRAFQGNHDNVGLVPLAPNVFLDVDELLP